MSIRPAHSMRLTRTRVAENREIAPGVFCLAIERAYDFIPGQTLALTVDPDIPPRYYSVASGTSDSLIEILYDVVPEGLLTPRLARLAPGDELLASEGFGAFRDGEGASVWVGAGTGIAPFASMARSGMVTGKTLVHGSRTLAGLHLRGYFSSVLKDRYVPCCTAETATGVFPGRTTAWLASAELPAAERYLLCGSAEMVVDARDILIARDVPFARIVAEIYF